MIHLKTKLFALLTATCMLCACSNQEKDSDMDNSMSNFNPKPYVELIHPDWSKNATIYEVNVRQYTPEGTFNAFSEHLPRLKEMGIDILWLMPIHPIGEENRKGSLGSYYSVKDYYAINPEFGTSEDFKALIDKAHSMGMYVILDWVANHSAWDNPLVNEHPDWYTKDAFGNFQPTAWYDWEDIIDFDFNVPEFRAYMTDAMKYWVKDYNIDGFRCDVAGFIPVDFWENVRMELETIKPVFMLAEWESRDLHKLAFDMTYSWSLWDKLHNVCSKGASPLQLEGYMAHDVNAFPTNGFRMTFIDNHDKNSWEGNMYSNFGEGLEAAIVFCATVRGMPLVYSGQEAGLNRSLAFFDKDEIVWQDHPFKQLYTKLFTLKHRNEALWNGSYGGEMIRVVSDKPSQIISFYREKNGYKVLAVFNLSNEISSFTLIEGFTPGIYSNALNPESGDITINRDLTLQMEPWSYLVLEQAP